MSRAAISFTRAARSAPASSAVSASAKRGCASRTRGVTSSFVSSTTLSAVRCARASASSARIAACGSGCAIAINWARRRCSALSCCTRSAIVARTCLGNADTDTSTPKSPLRMPPARAAAKISSRSISGFPRLLSNSARRLSGRSVPPKYCWRIDWLCSRLKPSRSTMSMRFSCSNRASGPETSWESRAVSNVVTPKTRTS